MSKKYEQNIIEIWDFLVTDRLSTSISLKELTSSNSDAANYLFTRFNLDKSCDLTIAELKTHINSYPLSKEFLNVLKKKVNIDFQINEKYNTYQNKSFNLEFKHPLFSCCRINRHMCLYVTFCHWCALADLSVLLDECIVKNPSTRWWIIIGIFGFLNIVLSAGSIIHGDVGRLIILAHVDTFIGIYIALAATNTIAKKLDFQFDRGSCFCFFKFYFCFSCKICQIANQLGPDKNNEQCAQTVELVNKINQHTPVKNMLAYVSEENQVDLLEII